MNTMSLKRPFLRNPFPFTPNLLFIVVGMVAAIVAIVPLANASSGGEKSILGAPSIRIEEPNLPGADEMFDLGRKVFRGKAPTVPGLEICLSVYDDELIANRAVPISRKLVKEFKGQHITRITTRLIDCSKPKFQVAQVLSPSEFQSLVYYLNKRFRLRLKN